MSYFARTARASANVVGSGTVGPEAITAGSSPGTSEITNVTTRAGAAAAARRPPLIADRCFLTALISPIVAPERNNARVTACLSASVRPAGGGERRLEQRAQQFAGRGMIARGHRSTPRDLFSLAISGAISYRAPRKRQYDPKHQYYIS